MTTNPTNSRLNRREMLGGVAALGAAGAISTFSEKAAASGRAASSARPALAQDAKVSFGTGGSDAELEMFDKILDRFQEANSGYEVDRRYDPTQTWPKVINQLRSGTASDVQRLNDDSVFMMVSVDAVKVIDEWFDRDLVRADYYDIAFTERVGPGGTLASPSS